MLQTIVACSSPSQSLLVLIDCHLVAFLMPCIDTQSFVSQHSNNGQVTLLSHCKTMVHAFAVSIIFLCKMMLNTQGFLAVPLGWQRLFTNSFIELALMHCGSSTVAMPSSTSCICIAHTIPSSSWCQKKWFNVSVLNAISIVILLLFFEHCFLSCLEW